MIRSCLAAASTALALTIPALPALASDPPTAAEFFQRFNVPEGVAIEAQDDGSVLITSSYDGWVVFSLREDEVPAVGERAVSIDITVVEDGGGWPEVLVGFGMVQGYDDADPGAAFSIGVVSPQDGGTLRLGSHTGNGFSIRQSMGGSLGLGETVTLTMSEEDGGLAFTAGTDGGSTQSRTSNDLIREALAGDGRIGFILTSPGTYRVANLVVTQAG